MKVYIVTVAIKNKRSYMLATDTRNWVFVVCYRHPKISFRAKICGFWESKIKLIRSKLAKLSLILVLAKSDQISMILDGFPEISWMKIFNSCKSSPETTTRSIPIILKLFKSISIIRFGFSISPMNAIG